jgi:hypothetical protein
MLIFTIALIALYEVVPAFSLTPSDLPECAVECYVKGVREVGIDLGDYEGQCRSAPFQIAMRNCAALNCEYDEYQFVCEFSEDANRRLRMLLASIVWRTLMLM